MISRHPSIYHSYLCPLLFLIRESIDFVETLPKKPNKAKKMKEYLLAISGIPKNRVTLYADSRLFDPDTKH